MNLDARIVSVTGARRVIGLLVATGMSDRERSVCLRVSVG